MEIWKNINGYEGYYQISNYGVVRSLDRCVKHGLGEIKICGKLIKTYINKNGYEAVLLSKNNSRVGFEIHRLVALTFIERSDKTMTVNHIDEDKLNNYVGNLEWIPMMDNIRYGTRAARSAENNKKPIIQFDTKGKVVKEWGSAKEAAKICGYSAGHISEVCSGKRNTYHGFIWKFAQ